MTEARQTRINFARIMWTSLAGVVILLAAVWFGGRHYLGTSAMPYQGNHSVPGLGAAVEILFDGRGIPRIYAETDADAVRALGWLHAGERLFQMELIRKVARGELAEIVGPAALEMDVLHRGLGFARRVREEPVELALDTASLVEAYVAGINAFVSTADRLPPEFILLGLAPEPWTAQDVVAVAYYQTFYPMTLVQRLSEAWREIVEAFGQPASEWLAALPEWTAATIPAPRMSEASNTWVVAPAKSASGHALHAADPHLDYTMAPGLWYAAGLHVPGGLDVVGVTAPGLPFVAMGHNGRIAWAFTVAPVDVFEFYLYRRHPEDPQAVRGPEGREEVSVRSETFHVRDAEAPIQIDVLTTRLGVVLESGEDSLLAMHWAGFDLDPADVLENGLALNRAGDFEAFRRAASEMGALSVNWSYSDAAGNIGYVQSTPIPRRRHRRFFSVLDAADPENIWDGYWPPEDRPHVLNPRQGWLANSNKNALEDPDKGPVPGFYKQLRMRRARAHLSGPGPFDTGMMRAMQLDRVSDRALSWKDWLAEVAEASGRPAIAGELRDWDGAMSAESETAGLFARWWQHLPRHLFGELEAPDWRVMRVALDRYLHDPPEEIARNSADLDKAALAALDDTLRQDIVPLGAIQHLTIAHPLARAGILDAWLDLSRGPIPIGGDPGSLNVTYHSFNEADSTLTARAGASMRYVLDWADPDAFTLNLTLGQSGHPLSPHFDDFLPAFLDGTGWTVPFERREVEGKAHSRLVLSPL